MSTLGDDCYFYYTSTCAKGASCPFRHVEAAKTCKIICQHWQMGSCLRPMCRFRHSTFPVPSSTSDTACYWENQPVGCTKSNCPYKHFKVKPDCGTAPDTPATITTDSTVTKVPGSNQSQSIAAQGNEGESNALKQECGTEASKDTTPASSTMIKSDDASHKEKDNESSNKENGNNTAPSTVAKKTKVKKIVPKAGVKKKVPGSTGKTKVVKKGTVKKVVKKKVVKKAVSKSDADAKTTDPRKNVKERLGNQPTKATPAVHSGQTKDDGSESDSADSVDNIKVMSMEDLLRQRALESMMKKRAAEGKPLAGLDSSKTEKSNAAAAKAIPKKKATLPSGKIVLKKKPQAKAPVTPVRKVKPKPPLVTQNIEEESSSDSSSSSSSEESEDSDDPEPDVRRVVVEVDNEKAARERAKASLLKRQAGSSGGPQAGRVIKAKDKFTRTQVLSTKKLKGRMVNMEYNSDDVVSSRLKAPLSVKDRLGKPPLSPKAVTRVPQPGNRKVTGEISSPLKVKPNIEIDSSNDSSSSEDSNFMEDVKVKTLEEIRREKMKNSTIQQQQQQVERDDAGMVRGLSVKQRLGAASPLKEQGNEEDGGGRQVLISQDSGSKSDDSSNKKPSEAEKKAKRRPWRSKMRVVIDEITSQQSGGDGDERTAVVISSHLKVEKVDKDPASGTDRLTENSEIDESPFARLKRRALMRKMQTLQQIKGLSPIRNIVEAAKSLETPEEGVVNDEEKEEADGDSHKKHKHKHKSKHRKKSKKERQIYMPPALKSAAAGADPSPGTAREKPPVAQVGVLTGAPTIKVAPQRRAGPHPMAAAWAAGLSLSHKGAVGSRPVQPLPKRDQSLISERPATEVKARLGLAQSAQSDPVEPTQKPSSSLSTISSSAPNPSGEVTIKSFTEIMAEKRRRRLEMQAKKAAGTPDSAMPSQSSSSPAASHMDVPGSSPAKLVMESKARIPIQPIVFNSVGTSSSPVKSKSFPSQTSILKSAQKTLIPQRASAPTQSSASSKLPPSSSASVPQTSQVVTSMPAPHLPSDAHKIESSSQGHNLNIAPSGHKTGVKKSGMQRKMFKKKKSVECLTSPAQDSLVDLGISIPLPPMTLEEELLLDEGPSTSNHPMSSDHGDIVIREFGDASLPPAEGQTVSQISGADMPQDTQPHQQTVPQLSPSVPTPLSPSQSPGVSLVTASKHRLSSSASSDVPSKKSRLSIDEQLALLAEGGDMDSYGDTADILTDSLEPIDDLLQNIDDLLA